MQRISFFQRILFPLLIVSIMAVFFTAIYMFSINTAQIAKVGNEEAEEISHLLTMAKRLIGERVVSSMALLQHHTTSLGAPSLNGTTILRGRIIPKLMMGKTSVTEKITLVDNVTDIGSGTATIFVKDQDQFIRITTNVLKKDQQRAIATKLDPQGSVIKQLRQGLAFYGIVDILGEPYITGYEPIFDAQQSVIGAWYVGYKVDVKALEQAIKQWHYLGSGFVAVTDYNQKIRFISEGVDKQLALDIIFNNHSGWILLEKDIPDWGFHTYIAYPKKEAYLASINRLYPMLIAGSIFGIIILFLARKMIKRLVLEPLGGDPDKASALVRRIAKGDLNDDSTIAKSGTLIDNMVKMRTQLRNMVTKIQDNADRLSISSSVFANVHDGIFITNAQAKIIEVNPAFSRITGYKRDESIDQQPQLLGFAHEIDDFFEEYFKSTEYKGVWRGEVWNLNKGGIQYLAWLDMFPVFTESGEFRHYVGIFADITKAKEQQNQLEHQAYHDALTKLPNRILFTKQLEKIISKAHAKNAFAVCYLDLDNFKPINDNHGHQVGDQLLVLLASRLKNVISKKDMIARFGGDEFALLLTGGRNHKDFAKTLDKLIIEIEKPFIIYNETFNVSASIGYTIYPNDKNTPDILLRHADNAMYHAKTHGGRNYHLFDPQLELLSRSQHQIGEEIILAIDNDEFKLHFQPQVNIATGDIIGFEALIRWQHPLQGLLLPGDFLPTIEHTQLIIDIGKWVIKSAFSQLAFWNKQGQKVDVSINIAAFHLTEERFVDYLKKMLREYPDVSGSQLCLEITESAAINDINNVTNIIKASKKLGLSYAIDDFGAGYSSLIYLRKLPVDIIKIDQSFIHDMLKNPEDLAVIASVVTLSNEFKRQVIAEGVETHHEADKLLELGCQLAQGFGIAKPMPAEQVLDWLQANSPFKFIGRDAESVHA